MKVSSIAFLLVLGFLGPAASWPGMRGLESELAKRLAAQGSGGDTGTGPGTSGGGGAKDEDPDEHQLIGDLATVGATSAVGTMIQNILLGTQSAESNEGGYKPPGPMNSAKCKADTCCVWSYVSAALTLEFKGLTGRCNDNARAAIRLGFHDAGTWSKSLAAQGSDFGGADGSIVLSKTEISRAENKGLGDIIGKVKVWSNTFGVKVADLIQFAAIHAVVTCPLGPRIRVFVGREDSSKEAPNNLLPGVNDSADKLIALFQDKTITPHALTALLGAHSTSRQFFVDPAKAKQPQDDTPGVWDVRFYGVTLANNAPNNVFKFASDVTLSTDPRVSSEWNDFAFGKDAQKHWNEDFAVAYTRLSLLGVNNINKLVECTKVLPPARPSFPGANIPFIFQ